MNVFSPDRTSETPEPFAVATSLSLQERRYHTLKSGDTFGIFDRSGDILSQLGGTDGLYHEDMRHLSHLDLTLGGLRPLLLSTSLAADNLMLTSDVSNAVMRDHSNDEVDQGVVHVQRSMFLASGVSHGRLSVRSFAVRPLKVQLALRFAADFIDLFEVRGMHRKRRGEQLLPKCWRDHVVLSYRGLDELTRSTCLAFEPAPQRLTGEAAIFDLELAPGVQTPIFLEIACSASAGRKREPRSGFLAAYVDIKRGRRASAARAATVTSDNDEFDGMVRRSTNDLRMLITDKPTGPYPYAGIPWFSTAFGRDALITALLVLAFDPALARGVLTYLAKEQAVEFDPVSEAEPGKILHETRAGEMALLGEVPFRRYYGSVDSTPLFIMLAGAYLNRTGDIGTVCDLWPNIDAALAWIDRRADVDGFVRYKRQTEQGLLNQGWKDSYDAISRADGTLAHGAIALCEVQGYVYAARMAGAEIARRLGLREQATKLETQAAQLKRAFEARFWCDRLDTYALALDETGQCQVRSSNAGQLLMTGIATPERAYRVATGLMEARFFTGWGVRTLPSDEVRYNPMSYHNGSVWPHDNALIALGMARIGLREETLRLFDCLRAAAASADLYRLPELFCGFSRRPHQAPTSYPVACTPQAWAAAVPLALLQACLGLSFDADASVIRFDRPDLPPFVDRLALHNVSLGDAWASVLITRTLGGVAVSVLERRGTVRIVTTS
jgi:glycogen debranching enzyme